MKKLIALLLLVSCVARAALWTENVPQMGVNHLIVTGGWTDFTNQVQRATAGQWVVVPPGPKIHVLTNQVTLRRPGVNLWIYPDMVFGSGGDNTVHRPVFDDMNIATTNTIVALGKLVISNKFSSLVRQSNSASRLTMICNEADYPVTVAPGISLIYAERGVLTITAHQRLRHMAYDAVWLSPSAADLYANITAAEIYAQNSAVEITGNAARQGDLVVNVGQVGGVTGDILSLVANCTINAGRINLGTAGLILLNGSAGTMPLINCPEIVSDSAGTVAPISLSQGTGHIRGAKIVGPTNFSAIEVVSDQDNTGVILEDCEIVSTTISTAYPYAVSTLLGLSSLGIQVRGTLTLNRPVDDFTALNGGQIIGPPLTNSYAGTNVFVNIGGHTDQVLVATNAMLLVLTNATTLQSGKAVTLTIYNNKATNMNVAYSADGFRPMNQVQNTVTNGRSLLLNIKRIGTNNQVTAFQQQN